MIDETVDEFYAFGVKRVQKRGAVKKFLLDWFPEYLLKQINFELHMLFVRLRALRSRRAFIGKTDLLINVGAGDVGKPGWINLDGYMARGINCLCDGRKYLPFEDGSVKGIFTEHFFEHLDYAEEAPRFLSEALRVLKPGGVIRIIVPDAEKYLRAYCTEGWAEFTALRPLEANFKDHHFNFRYNTRMELVNVLFRQGYEHKFLYDFETLQLLLERNGFSGIQKQQFGRSIDPEICIDLAVRASESLYVDAVKPPVTVESTLQGHEKAVELT